MNMSRSATIKGLMAHGHSRLIWLLDDIEAHILGLRGDPDSRSLILEELVSFTRSFSEELEHHIEEEESDIFPMAVRVAEPDEKEEIQALHDEHERLQEDMAEFWEELQRLCDEPDASDWSVDELAAQVHSLRRHLTDHSTHEREVLSEMQQRISGTPA